MVLRGGSFALLTACFGAACAADTKPLALVYRGPAACTGCSEAAGALIERSGMRVRYCGPEESTALNAEALTAAELYAQPGGGDVAEAWPLMRPYAGVIGDWVSSGGRYLGLCLGGYLAGARPGFGLLPGNGRRYITSAGATIDSTIDTVARVRWRNTPRWMYFQDGARFDIDGGAEHAVLATYDNDTIAVVVARHGRGVVGVSGPHPEADESWYAEEDLTNPDGIRFDLGDDLVRTTRTF